MSKKAQVDIWELLVYSAGLFACGWAASGDGWVWWVLLLGVCCLTFLGIFVRRSRLNNMVFLESPDRPSDSIVGRPDQYDYPPTTYRGASVRGPLPVKFDKFEQLTDDLQREIRAKLDEPEQ